MTDEEWYFWHARAEFRNSPDYSSRAEYAEFRNPERWLDDELARNEARMAPGGVLGSGVGVG